MKRWEQQELKRVANEFVKDFCQGAYEYYLDSALEGDYESQSQVDSWSTNKFNIHICDTKDGVVSINLHGLNKVNYSDSIRLSDLVELDKEDKYGFYSLRELIYYLNKSRIVPNYVDIECTYHKLTKLSADGVVYIDIQLVDFLKSKGMVLKSTVVYCVV